MQLKNKIKITGIKKKTSAKFFKDLKVGDEITLSYNLSGAYKSAPTIDIYVDEDIVHWNNAIQLSDNLDKFEFAEVKD